MRYFFKKWPFLTLVSNTKGHFLRTIFIKCIVKVLFLEAATHEETSIIGISNQGLARTQIPTNKNDVSEFPTFEEIAGVSHPEVQWNSLALEELPW